jgi:SAM-dependent methyltransferase
MAEQLSHYRSDLAWIHHAGFSEFAESASMGVLETLWRHGVHDGLVIDVGCGSGILARELTRAGFEVLGIDPSPSMIEIAQRTAPAARFVVGALDNTPLPPCRAITATGEVLNYATLDRVGVFLRHAAAALPSRGLLLFDIAEQGSLPQHEERRAGGEDWSVIILEDSDGRRLTRRVLTFRRTGDVTRRDEEVHTLELYERAAFTSLLRGSGFRVRFRRSYGSDRLPRGHAVALATRV